MAMLVLLDPAAPETRTAYKLAGPEIVLGRDPTCGVRIVREGVSRHHARVFVNGDHWVVEDLQSTNGCYVNDVRVDRSVLREADFLSLGNAIFRFHLAGGLELDDNGDDGGGSGADPSCTASS